MRRPALRRWGWPLWPALPLLALGLWQAGAGLSIHLKALLGQMLLERAWERTLAGESRVRPWPWADTWPVARLTVPEHGIDLIVLEGATGATLAWGPGRLAGTAAIGEPGLTVLSGHRDTHFRFLERLRPGDGVALQTAEGVLHRYRITRTAVVDHRTAALPAGGAGSAVVLVTCYPFGAVVPGGPAALSCACGSRRRARTVADRGGPSGIDRDGRLGPLACDRAGLAAKGRWDLATGRRNG